ncbi:hypothetical protein CERZMDRAFT_85441 [Cercospora zeae-maydis SCOH1-5]|uniref:Uncharacterized protein n=1 Tax=Cercospora zeae-maydis SCOH1-5 TaxID=717836 RepID=A0A6A6FCY1_9PEZI|nr:hypothetical protein CERZMDRAFT_85441 [Cercospora zeae-maydis SCOH1-5]
MDKADISLELELFGEESADGGFLKGDQSGSNSAGNKRKAVTDSYSSTTSPPRKKKLEKKSAKFDSKGFLREESDAKHLYWAPFQFSDDPKETRQNNAGKDIPTNHQLKKAYATDTIDTKFDDHTQLRAWLKIHQQPSGGKYADLVGRIGEYIEERGGEIDDRYGTVKAVRKKASRPKKQKVLTRAEILAAAQKAFEEANQPKVQPAGTKPQASSSDKAREGTTTNMKRSKTKQVRTKEGDPDMRSQ